jgi:uncharacterized membrane protein (DUF441 family)
MFNSIKRTTLLRIIFLLAVLGITLHQESNPLTICVLCLLCLEIIDLDFRKKS